MHTRARARVFVRSKHARSDAVGRADVADCRHANRAYVARTHVRLRRRPHARNVFGQLVLFMTALYLFPWSAILFLLVAREPRTRTAAARLRETCPHLAITRISILAFLPARRVRLERFPRTYIHTVVFRCNAAKYKFYVKPLRRSIKSLRQISKWKILQILII